MAQALCAEADKENGECNENGYVAFSASVGGEYFCHNRMGLGHRQYGPGGKFICPSPRRPRNVQDIIRGLQALDTSRGRYNSGAPLNKSRGSGGRSRFTRRGGRAGGRSNGAYKPTAFFTDAEIDKDKACTHEPESSASVHTTKGSKNTDESAHAPGEVGSSPIPDYNDFAYVYSYTPQGYGDDAYSAMVAPLPTTPVYENKKRKKVESDSIGELYEEWDASDFEPMSTPTSPPRTGALNFDKTEPEEEGFVGDTMSIHQIPDPDDDHRWAEMHPLLNNVRSPADTFCNKIKDQMALVIMQLHAVLMRIVLNGFRVFGSAHTMDRAYRLFGPHYELYAPLEPHIHTYTTIFTAFMVEDECPEPRIEELNEDNSTDNVDSWVRREPGATTSAPHYDPAHPLIDPDPYEGELLGRKWLGRVPGKG